MKKITAIIIIIILSVATVATVTADYTFPYDPDSMTYIVMDVFAEIPLPVIGRPNPTPEEATAYNLPNEMYVVEVVTYEEIGESQPGRYNITVTFTAKISVEFSYLTEAYINGEKRGIAHRTNNVIVVNMQVSAIEDIGYNTPNGTISGGGTGAVNMESYEIKRAEHSGLELVIIELFGEYTPAVYRTTGTKTEYIQEIGENGEIKNIPVIYDVATIEYGINWEWFVGVALFMIILYSFFRCVGGLLKWNI